MINMLTLNDIQRRINISRDSGLPYENYWLYVSADGTEMKVSGEEDRTEGYTGYFIEDDTRLRKVYEIICKRVRK